MHEATPVLWHAADIHTNKGKIFEPSLSMQQQNNATHCPDPSLIIQVTTMSLPGDNLHLIACQHTTQGVEETFAVTEEH